MERKCKRGEIKHRQGRVNGKKGEKSKDTSKKGEGW